MTGLAALAVAGVQTQALAQYLSGSTAGKAYMIYSGVNGVSLTSTGPGPMVLDDPGWGGSGTQLNVWSVNYGSNQYWLLDNLGGNDSDYYTIQAYWANSSSQPLCMDCSNSGTAPGTVVQVWDCNGTGAQNWAFQSAGLGKAYKIVPWNDSSMALSTPGGSNGALLTLQPQIGLANPYDSWYLAATDESQLTINNGTGSAWCNAHYVQCTFVVLGSVAVGTTALVISTGFPYFVAPKQVQDAGAAQVANTNAAQDAAQSAERSLVTAVTPQGPVIFRGAGNTPANGFIVDMPPPNPTPAQELAASAGQQSSEALLDVGESERDPDLVEVKVEPDDF